MVFLWLRLESFDKRVDELIGDIGIDKGFIEIENGHNRFGGCSSIHRSIDPDLRPPMGCFERTSLLPLNRLVIQSLLPENFLLT